MTYRGTTYAQHLRIVRQLLMANPGRVRDLTARVARIERIIDHLEHRQTVNDTRTLYLTAHLPVAIPDDCADIDGDNL